MTEWEEPAGKGAIFAFGAEGASTYIEIYEMGVGNARYDASFSEPIQNDKIDLQLRTDTLDAWVDTLVGVWPFEGPEQLPWGQTWIKLRDPDGLQIAIYEGED